MDFLKTVANKYDIDITDKQLDQFNKYYEMLIETNKVMNLTAITEKDEVIIKHFLDSIILLKYIDISNAKIIDIGTGAGFPGIPLKIMVPSIKLTLLDSLNKRLKFLDSVCETLSFDNVELVHGRAEDIGRKPEHREQYDYAVSRAVANMSTLLEYSLPFVKVKGCFISYKSVNIKDELHAAKKAVDILGGKVRDCIELDFDEFELNRNLVLIDKIKPISKKYPRKAGTPSKEPL